MINWERFKKTKAIGLSTVVPAFTTAGEDYCDELLTKEANKIKSCGTVVKAVGCKTCGEKYFKGFSKCKSKYCPTCSAMKGAIWCAKLYPKIDEWLKTKKYVCFGTFTIPNQEDLEVALDVVYKAWRYMTNKLVPAEWKKRFAGGVKSVEVKIGKYSKKWHVHIHAMFFRDKYGRDHHFLREAWIKSVQHFLGDVQVNVPRIESIKNKATTKKEKDIILGAICETVKYMTKINHDMETYLLVEAFNNLKGRRQISCWGILRGLTKKVEEVMDDESENLVESFKCATCGSTLSEFLEIWDEAGNGYKDLTMKEFKDVVTFVPAVEELPLNYDRDKDEDDKDWEQITFL